MEYIQRDEYVEITPKSIRMRKRILSETERRKWAVRDDVWIHYLDRKGMLTAGFGVKDDRIGPELGFGRVIGDATEAPVLLIKCAWGGKSLAVDFRPPGAGGETGPYYKKMIAGVRAALVSYAREFKDLADRHFPKAPRIRLVQDNLNTHTTASLYEAFPPAEARRIAERFEVHYTPKHGSWLNMAEIELAVLASQCLDRRIPDKDHLAAEVQAWMADRNTRHAKANWQFKTTDARIKLRHLYPSL